MDGLYVIAAIVALLLLAGAVIAAASRGGVDWRWLGIAAALVVLNDALLTRVYRTIPDLLPAANWNWQGKLAALAATLLIAALPVFGWRRAGLTLRQAPGSLAACIPVVIAYAALFVALAMVFPNDPPTTEALAFQLTMPGLEEEAFYRGLLLLALDRAFTGRRRWLGIDWGWGAIVSCMLFGLAHALGHGDDGYSFSAAAMALTGIPSLLAVWLRLRTGSIALPFLLHNFGNTIGYLL